MKRRILVMTLAMVLAVGLFPMMAGAVDYSYKSWEQYDSRWGSMSIGGGYTMGGAGCYVTAVAKLLVHAGQQDPATFTPKECLEGMLAHGMLTADGLVNYGNFNNSFLPTYGPDLEKLYTNPREMDKADAIQTISNEISNGCYVIVMVDSQWGQSTHYLAVDYVSDDIYVMDNGGVIALYRDGPACGYSAVKDLVRFKYSGPYAYAAIDHISGGDESETTAPPSSVDGPTKTQYRYHRYEDPVSHDYFVCAYLGLNYYSSMQLVYSDWVDAPYPEVKKGYNDYLVHPHQGGCETSGCLSSDPFEVHRHVDPSGKVWYYEETRQVPAEVESTPTPTPSAKPSEPVTPSPKPSETATPSETVTPSPTSSAKPSQPSVTPSEKTSQPPATPSEKPTETDKKGALPLPATRSYAPDLFWDVKTDAWFYNNVADAYEMGLMNGTGANSFSPGNNMTLAEAVTLAARIHSLYHNGAESFTRYDGGSWYDPYVDYARENKIIDVNYDYSRPATREEFVHILARALPETELACINEHAMFDDHQSVVYISDVELLSKAGIINGIPEAGVICFKPNNTITRAEVAAVVARMARPASRIGK